MTSPQPWLHPWLVEAGTWLPAGLAHATQLAVSSEVSSDLASVSRLLSLCRDGVVGDLERQQVAEMLGKMLIKMYDAWDGCSEKKADIDRVNKEVWNGQKCGVVNLGIEPLSRLLNFSEDLFISQCEDLIVTASQDSVFDSHPLLRVVPCDRDLFQKLLRVFSTLLDHEEEVNVKMLEVLRKIFHFVLSQQDNPILMFPVRHRALVGLLLHDRDVSSNETIFTQSANDDLDVKLLKLLFDLV